MKLKKLYEEVIRIGIDNDPRGKSEVTKILKEREKEYQSIDKKEQDYFDLEKLRSPFSDTRILFGDLETEVKNVLIGIDVEGPEILLADRLREKGKKIDLAISHHPEGIGLANLADVMSVHSDILSSLGVATSIAESLIADRAAEVSRRLLPANHMRSVAFAQLLNIPFMSIHTAADNCVNSYLGALLNKKKPESLGDTIDILLTIKEYQDAASINAGPRIVAGSKKNKAAKILVDMTGGTETSKDVFSKIAASGVSTIICMHLSEEHLKKVKEAHLNAIIAGHISSDNLGLNLLFDKVEQKQKLNFIECSGFKRIRRLKK
ncbi:MAG: NGG1p interacting factor NIF3 [Candidatus Kaelpia aquatica]|nr:NGG1p interacting factor NIF3 [Candidatus Kaelpia aquatica]